MSNLHVTLRYRPVADVLTASVDLAPLAGTWRAPVTHTPDADTSLTWRSGHVAGVRLEVLEGVQLVHARAGLAAGPPGWVPLALVSAANRLIASSAETLDHLASPTARLRAVAEMVVEVPVDALRRATPAIPPQSPGRAHAHHVGSAVHELGAALAARSPDPSTDVLAHRLEELASVLVHSGGRTAPATSAAARSANVAGVALLPSQRDALGRILIDLDHPDTWPSATRRLQLMVAALGLDDEGGRP